MKTDDQLVNTGKQIVKLYVDTNALNSERRTLLELLEHAVVQAYRTGYRAREGEVVDRSLATKLVESVLNSRRGYGVDGLDDVTRADLLGAIVDAARAEVIA